MSKGFKRFFAVCAVLICMGLVLSIVGYFTGGVRNLDKMDDKYSWIKVGKADMTYMQLDEGATFDAIDVKGVMDVIICRGDSSKTRLCFDSKENVPQLQVKDGVLMADVEAKDHTAVINFCTGDSTPYVEIYVPEDKKLKDINISSEYGDVNIENIKAGKITILQQYGDAELTAVEYETLDFSTQNGDIDGERIKSGGLCIESQYGDIELQGEFRGKTEIESESGDVEIDTMLAPELYTINADVELGELSIGETEYDNIDKQVKFGSGDNIMEIVSKLGDVDIGFER